MADPSSADCGHGGIIGRSLSDTAGEVHCRGIHLMGYGAQGTEECLGPGGVGSFEHGLAVLLQREER